LSDFSSLKGQLLISLPSTEKDYFSHTVTLLIEHNRDGAFGLIINRPLEEEYASLLAEQHPGYSGRVDLLDMGPVEQNRLFFLHSNDQLFENSLQLNDELTLSTSPDLLDVLAEDRGPDHVAAGLGYAGWSGGQLEDEILRNVWLVTPYVSGITFSVPFEHRPEAAASSIGIDLNLIAPEPGHG
jgi:putative transcriptional regulator